MENNSKAPCIHNMQGAFELDKVYLEKERKFNGC